MHEREREKRSEGVSKSATALRALTGVFHFPENLSDTQRRGRHCHSEGQETRTWRRSAAKTALTGYKGKHYPAARSWEPPQYDFPGFDGAAGGEPVAELGGDHLPNGLDHQGLPRPRRDDLQSAERPWDVARFDEYSESLKSRAVGMSRRAGRKEEFLHPVAPTGRRRAHQQVLTDHARWSSLSLILRRCRIASPSSIV
ncbi:hypothetical protein SAY87_020549 [Trapa incisa]|uniref:Uncharacterized protein n=1 Tax=Trapa incisa TaxID=236973 RepID=A0AAN7JR07_9MYRT|nr:hypothetical protein SAY87_020549 [Trapa incisa]